MQSCDIPFSVQNTHSFILVKYILNSEKLKYMEKYIGGPIFFLEGGFNPKNLPCILPQLWFSPGPVQVH